MYWNINDLTDLITQYICWIVTLDVLKSEQLWKEAGTHWRWIVTLDVLKYDMVELFFCMASGWIVTLDVLKFCYSFLNKPYNFVE